MSKMLWLTALAAASVASRCSQKVQPLLLCCAWQLISSMLCLYIPSCTCRMAATGLALKPITTQGRCLMLGRQASGTPHTSGTHRCWLQGHETCACITTHLMLLLGSSKLALQHQRMGLTGPRLGQFLRVASREILMVLAQLHAKW